MDHTHSGTGLAKGVEQQAHRLLHVLVRIEHDPPTIVIHETQRRFHPQLTTPGFVELTANQSSAQQVQLGLAHRSFQAQQQAVVKVARVVDPIFVEDERICQSADFQQPMPVGRAPCQTGNFQTHDHTHPTQPHLRHEALKTIAVGGGGARQAQVLIDHDDLIARPSQSLRPPFEIVLPRRALTVLVDLPQGGLANIEIRQPPQMFGGHFRR